MHILVYAQNAELDSLPSPANLKSRELRRKKKNKVAKFKLISLNSLQSWKKSTCFILKVQGYSQ